MSGGRRAGGTKPRLACARPLSCCPSPRSPAPPQLSHSLARRSRRRQRPRELAGRRRHGGAGRDRPRGAAAGGRAVGRGGRRARGAGGQGRRERGRRVGQDGCARRSCGPGARLHCLGTLQQRRRRPGLPPVVPPPPALPPLAPLPLTAAALPAHPGPAALHMAAANGHAEIVQLLIDAGAVRVGAGTQGAALPPPLTRRCCRHQTNAARRHSPLRAGRGGRQRLGQHGAALGLPDGPRRRDAAAAGGGRVAQRPQQVRSLAPPSCPARLLACSACLQCSPAVLPLQLAVRCSLPAAPAAVWAC